MSIQLSTSSNKSVLRLLCSSQFFFGLYCLGCFSLEGFWFLREPSAGFLSAGSFLRPAVLRLARDVSSQPSSGLVNSSSGCSDWSMNSPPGADVSFDNVPSLRSPSSIGDAACSSSFSIFSSIASRSCACFNASSFFSSICFGVTRACSCLTSRTNEYSTCLE